MVFYISKDTFRSLPERAISKALYSVDLKITISLEIFIDLYVNFLCCEDPLRSSCSGKLLIKFLKTKTQS